MILFALFTLGYFTGVITALLIFPPDVKDIIEQERDALKPIQEAYLEGGERLYNPPITAESLS
jgi:hypothetical protein